MFFLSIDKNKNVLYNSIITEQKCSVNKKVKGEESKMAAVMTNLKVSQDKVQLRMAEKCMDPYVLCSKAEISYAAYRQIMKKGGCKLSTLGKLAKALECEVMDIVE